MGSEWAEKTFQELLDDGLLEIGDGYRAKNAELDGDGPIFLRAGHVTDTHIDFSRTDRFRTELAGKVASKMAAAGDTIITTKGNSTGRTAFVTDDMPPFVYSPHLSYWRSLDEDAIVPGFLRYWALGREFAGQLQGMSKSTDMAPYLSLRDQRRLRITLPPLSEQRAIAGVLGSLDDKIALNRRMNRTVESIARALFQSWFVDFDPVRANAEGKPTLPPDLAACFPAAFADSHLGDIPAGWEVKSASDVLDINPKRKLMKGTVAPYLDMKNMPTDAFIVGDVIDREFKSGSKFINGDTLLARITPCLENGKTAYVDFLEGKATGWGSTEYIVLRPKPPLPPEFAYYLARSDRFRTYAIQSMTGTSGRQRVPPTCFDNHDIVAPSREAADAYAAAVRPLMAKMRANETESRTLAALRDALLPKLLGGELSVANDGVEVA